MLKTDVQSAQGKHGLGDKSECGASIHTLLIYRQTTSKGLLYGPGDSTQCSATTKWEKNLRKDRHVHTNNWTTLLHT